MTQVSGKQLHHGSDQEHLITDVAFLANSLTNEGGNNVKTDWRKDSS